MTVWEYGREEGDGAFHLLNVFLCLMNSKQQHSNDSDSKIHRLLNSQCKNALTERKIYIFFNLCDISNFFKSCLFSQSVKAKCLTCVQVHLFI